MADVLPIQEGENQTTEVIPISETSDNFGPEAGWEFDFARKNPFLYPLVRTAADIVPFASFAFPSGRKEFSEASLGGKALHIGLDALALLPAGVIGKGLKLSMKPFLTPIAAGLKKLPFRIKTLEEARPILDDLMRKVDKAKYVTPEEGLIKKYNLATDEVDALFAGEKGVWVRSARSGSSEFYQSSEMAKLFRQDGSLTEPVAWDLARWSVSRADQRLIHYKEEYGKFIKGMLPASGKYKVEDVFSSQVSRLFNGDLAKSLTLESIDAKTFSQVLMDSLLNEGKILRKLDIGNLSYLLPTRKVFGPLNERFGLLDKIYNPIKVSFGRANASGYMNVTKYHQILKSRGLGSFTKRGYFKKSFTPESYERAGVVVRMLDNAQGKGLPVQGILEAEHPMVQAIVKSYHEWTDYMYAEYTKGALDNLFNKAGLTAEGKLSLKHILDSEGQRLDSKITEMIAAGNNLDYKDKLNIFSGVLGRMKSDVIDHPEWFKTPGGKRVERLLEGLEFRKPGENQGFPNYLDNYGQRIFERPARRARQLPRPGVQAGFVKARTQEEAPEAISDLAKLVEIRVRQQGKELHVYPKMGEIVRTAKDLPENLKKFTAHYINRMLGNPSEMDKKVAGFLTKTLGGAWDARRVQALAYKINDLIYLGGIGFKPFSAMRNYIQPLLMVPADMGGVKDLIWLTRGYKRAFQSETRKYIQSIGAIAEYTPDLLFAPHIAKAGKGLKILGKEFELPTREQIRDLGMWMFKGSDRHNRYVTGGAALDKWEHFFNKFAKTNRNGDMYFDGRALAEFEKKIRLGSRESWVSKEIHDQLRLGTGESLKTAKDTWVKDVIADTQYLYGSADSPLISQPFGILGRTGVVFQSWWMNYASALGKWSTRTGSIDATAERLFTFMLSAAIANQIMEPVWGEGTARRTVGAGPLPLEIDAPASWRPFIEGLKLTVEAGSVAVGLEDMEKLRARAKAVISSGAMFVPGGLQIKTSVTGALEEGFPGFAKSLIRYRGSEK